MNHLTLKVLVVDDDLHNRELAVMSLGILAELEDDIDMEVQESSNGEDALRMLIAAVQPFTHALIDIMMPVMNGWTLLNEIRARENLKGMVAIAATAKAMEGDEQLCLDAGFDAYFAKPINIDDLIPTLRSTSKRKEASEVSDITNANKTTAIEPKQGDSTKPTTGKDE